MHAVIPGRRSFPTTRWTLILAAKSNPPDRREALELLLGDYWKPLYFFARRRGLSSDAAEDAVQGFLAHLLERDFIEALDPNRGRLRSYLRTALKNYLANLYAKEAAKKRGGDIIKVPLDFDVAESALSSTPDSPDVAFEREWALSVMRRALVELKKEFDGGLRGGPFELVLAYFGSGEAPPYREAAGQHDMTVPQLKAFLHRARKRFRDIVEGLVGDTVADAGAVPAETQTLLEGLKS